MNTNVNKAGKGDRITNQAIAKRLAYLRDTRFETKGFNGKVPTISEARAMHGYNLRLVNDQKPQPSVCR